MWLKPFYGLNFQSLLQMMLNLYQTFCHFRYFTLKGFRFESLLLLLPAFYIPTFFAALVCVRVVGMPVKLMGSKVFDLRPPRSCKDEQLKLSSFRRLALLLQGYTFRVTLLVLHFRAALQGYTCTTACPSTFVISTSKIQQMSFLTKVKIFQWVI